MELMATPDNKTFGYAVTTESRNKGIEGIEGVEGFSTFCTFLGQRTTDNGQRRAKLACGLVV